MSVLPPETGHKPLVQVHKGAQQRIFSNEAEEKTKHKAVVILILWCSSLVPKGGPSICYTIVVLVSPGLQFFKRRFYRLRILPKDPGFHCVSVYLNQTIILLSFGSVLVFRL